MESSTDTNKIMQSSEDDAVADEQSPLLASQWPGHSSVIHLPTLQSSRSISLTLILIIFFLALGFNMPVAPSARIIEDILCHQYYDKSGHTSAGEKIDEKFCKEDVIQEKLAFVIGILDMLSAIPGIFCAIPYGILADKIGRRPILYLAISGSLLSFLFQLGVLLWWHTFSLYLIFLGPMFIFIGGGDSVLLAMVYAIVADVSSEQDRAVHFLWISLGLMFSQLVGPAISGTTMTVSSPWVAEAVGVSFSLLGLGLAIILVPETFHIHKHHSPVLPPPNTENDQKPTLLSKLNAYLHNTVTKLKETGKILTSVSIVLLLLSFVTHLLCRYTERFTIVYVSKRYRWLLSETSYLLSFSASINIFLILVILPWISHLLTSSNSRLPFRYRITPPQKDLLLARTSIVLLTVGNLVVAGPSIHFVILGLFIATLGEGFSSLARAVITAMIDQRYIARLYTLISIPETLGAIAAGPALPWLFRMGLRYRKSTGSDMWLGLPFIGTSAVCAVVALGVLCVRLPDKTNDLENEDEDGDEVEADGDGERMSRDLLGAAA